MPEEWRSKQIDYRVGGGGAISADGITVAEFGDSSAVIIAARKSRGYRRCKHGRLGKTVRGQNCEGANSAIADGDARERRSDCAQ